RILLRRTTTRIGSARMDGGCSCGEVRYRLTGAPMFVHCCHCLNCQRQTGSAVVINALIQSHRVELLAGEPPGVDVPRDDGSASASSRFATATPTRVRPRRSIIGNASHSNARAVERIRSVLAVGYGSVNDRVARV